MRIDVLTGITLLLRVCITGMFRDRTGILQCPCPLAGDTLGNRINGLTVGLAEVNNQRYEQFRGKREFVALVGGRSKRQISYFPMQKVENIRVSMSSVVVSPVIWPSSRREL